MLPNLRKLWAAQIGATSIPDELAALKELRLLALGDNKIREVPEWLASLDKLDELYLEGNPITEIPASLRKRLDDGSIPNYFVPETSRDKAEAILAQLAELSKKIAELYVEK